MIIHKSEVPLILQGIEKTIELLRAKEKTERGLSDKQIVFGYKIQKAHDLLMAGDRKGFLKYNEEVAFCLMSLTNLTLGFIEGVDPIQFRAEVKLLGYVTQVKVEIGGGGVGDPYGFEPLKWDFL